MANSGKAGYAGSGPGEFTPDGCAVDLYARLPAEDEPEIIAAAVPPPATLLELGCGAGRVTRALTRLGYEVTAVDESAAMLAHVAGARTVRSPIEDLALPGTFDVVLLASFLVHGPTAAALLATCRRHVDYDGFVLIQREGADWHTRGAARARRSAGRRRPGGLRRRGPGRFRSVHVEYEFPDARWTQTFRTRPLTVEQFETLLVGAGPVRRPLPHAGRHLGGRVTGRLTGAAPSSVRSGSTPARRASNSEARSAGHRGGGRAAVAVAVDRAHAELDVVLGDVDRHRRDVADRRPRAPSPGRSTRARPPRTRPGPARCRPASAAWSRWSAAWCR